MLLQTILLIILIFVSASLVGVILMQQSEGGALGMGGGPSGFMSTRGAGDLLTRTTAILAATFFILCIVLTVVSGRAHGQSVVDRLKIDGLDANALAPKKPVLPPPTTGATAPTTFEAPKPEVHTAPASPNLLAPASPTLLSPAAPSAAPVAAKPKAHPVAKPASAAQQPALIVPAAPLPASPAPANGAAPKP